VVSQLLNKQEAACFNQWFSLVSLESLFWCTSGQHPAIGLLVFLIYINNLPDNVSTCNNLPFCWWYYSGQRIETEYNCSISM